MPFDTPLTPEQERQFQAWMQGLRATGQIHQLDMGQDYDFRGAFLSGYRPDANGHWLDTYKKPNHPTFSDESIYSSLTGTYPGSWNGEQYIPFNEADRQKMQIMELLMRQRGVR